jgi:hypothetical protein
MQSATHVHFHTARFHRGGPTRTKGPARATGGPIGNQRTHRRSNTSALPLEQQRNKCALSHSPSQVLKVCQT